VEKENKSKITFYLVDVFAERPLEGNPVAVVPDAQHLPEAAMQRIAREFNRSETTFLLPPTRAEADWRLRSYTPAGKEAFGAGHNTLGAWWWLAESGKLALGDAYATFHQEIGKSILPVAITSNEHKPVSIAMGQSAPKFGKVSEDFDGLAAALGLLPTDLATEHFPIQVVSTGAPHLLVRLRNRSAIERARPDFLRLGQLLHLLDAEGCYLFTLDTVEPRSAAHARFFNPTLGILEDPATGTAAGPLACQLAAHQFAKAGSLLSIEQGHTLGRPSLIRVHVSGNVVQVSGACVVSGEGTLQFH